MDTYRLYITIVEQGSFNRAAEKLGITQPTVSKQIDRLEEKLGVQLFKRSTRKLILTPAGKQFYKRAIEIDKLASETEHELKHMAGQGESILRIAASLSVATRVLPTVLKKLSSRHPEARYRLYMDEAVGPYFQQDFKLEYDLFIREGEAIESNLSARRLADIPLGFYASPEFLSNNHTPTSLQDMLDHSPCIGVNFIKSGEWGKKLTPDLQNLGWDLRLTGNEGLSLVPHAEAGLGILVSAKHMVQPALDRGTLVELDINHSMQKLPLTALYRREYLSPLARECLDLLIEQLEQQYPRE